MCDYSIEAKAYALDRVVAHLTDKASIDPRHRERMRARIALGKIEEFLKEFQEKAVSST